MASTTGKTRIVRSRRDGNFTIPAAFRRELGIGGESPLRVTLANGELHISPVPTSEPPTNAAWFKALYDRFAPAREEAVEQGYTDEEINAWIDEAVAEVRAKRD